MNNKRNIQFSRWVLRNMSTFFQVTLVFATRENGLTFLFVINDWGLYLTSGSRHSLYFTIGEGHRT